MSSNDNSERELLLTVAESDLRKLAAKIRRRSARISAKIRALQRDSRKTSAKAR